MSTSDELADVLLDLRRHLEWQAEDANARGILMERSALEALRAAGGSAVPRANAPVVTQRLEQSSPLPQPAARSAAPAPSSPAPSSARPPLGGNARPLAGPPSSVPNVSMPPAPSSARTPASLTGINPADSNAHAPASKPSFQAAMAGAMAARSSPAANANTRANANSAASGKPSAPAPNATGAVVPRTISELPKVEPVPEDQRRTLDEIRTELGDCKRCKLCSGRKNLVFGVGNPRAQLVFVGEGPGADEDAQGIPFVGKAGELLTRMIEAMGFSRDEVYICNIVKCRPPQNRTPELDEIAACEPFVRAQLAAIQPKAIVALGKVAAQTLLREEVKITSQRGQWREYSGIPLMPTFHPAYLLRQPAEKKLAWSDLQQVMKVFGKAPKSKAQTE